MTVAPLHYPVFMAGPQPRVDPSSGAEALVEYNGVWMSEAEASVRRAQDYIDRAPQRLLGESS